MIQKVWVGLRNCISNKLSGDVQAAGPWTTLERQGKRTSRRQVFTVQSAAHLETHHCLPVHSGFSPKWQPEPNEYRFLIPHFNYEASTVKPPYSGILYLQICLLAKISFQPQKLMTLLSQSLIDILMHRTEEHLTRLLSTSTAKVPGGGFLPSSLSS